MRINADVLLTLLSRQSWKKGFAREGKPIDSRLE